MDSATQEAKVVEAVEEKYKSNTEGRITNINSRTISIKAGSKHTDMIWQTKCFRKYNGSSSSVGKLRDYFDDFDRQQIHRCRAYA